ncbi:protein-glutamate methylesterase/protein-glutamine glutaminase [Peribacillus kribbensis]|uniref:protein-glutamate methylesterase/protein-glutamine glutaminase n=1 Tax=Peribacillus kribbensis TaxID=356658 RepID=UPI0004043209|nr:chemotaxis response regulator protein-glutamate methylesterase [Peribacillus kribbensis]
MEKIKVLVVDDSAFMRKFISEMISEDERMEVAGTARNGRDALDKLEKVSPDVITLDVEMPIMDGLSALEHIMAKHPVPCIMLSSTTKEGADNTLTAIAKGAFDFVPKPSGSISLDISKVKGLLLEKIAAASQANIRILCKQEFQPEAAGKSHLSAAEFTANPAVNPSSGARKIVCIGTSTGGPGALQRVLAKLPGDFETPILIVQHMPKGFTGSLAARLDSLCRITVKEAENGEIIRKGIAYIAPGGFHMKVKKAGRKLAVILDEGETRTGHRPSVDVLFESLSEQTDHHKVAVVMTGMGSDGAKGLIAMKKSGSVRAIAESSESAVVFGMPKAAIATKCVDRVEHVNDIALALIQAVKDV